MKNKETTLLIIKKENKILLARKKRGFGLGKWNGIGGKIEENETPEQAVIREIKEEFMVDIKLLGYLGENTTKNGVDYHYHAKIISGTPRLGGEEKEENNENNYYEIRKLALKNLSQEEINILPINISYIEKALKKEYK